MSNPRPVVDIKAYRDRKTLARMSTTQLQDRILLVRAHQEDGWASPQLQAAMMPITFPNGFDPTNHPEDNLELLEEEYVSRTG